MTDEPGALAMWVPQNITFDYTDATWVCLHKTAGFTTAQDCAAYFQSGSNGNNVSAHYIVGQDGTIVQCVPESRGAGANCCPTAGHAAYLPTDVNLNLKTISIEHIDPASDNSTPLTPAQQAASFRLVQHICERHNIPKRGGDASGGIIGHNDIDPINRARCPGNYPWQGLFTYLTGGASMATTVPSGWKDDGKTLTAPNGIPITQGFRDYILARNWDHNNTPLEPAHGLSPLELSNPGLGAGTRQTFRWTALEWTSKGGVFEAYAGQELYTTLDLLHATQTKLATLQDAWNKLVTEKNDLIAQVNQLKAAPTDNAEQLQQQVEQLQQQLATAATQIKAMFDKLTQINVISKQS